MSSHPHEPNLEELLQHASWLKGLALSLVKDPALADDMVQQTWVRALEHPPRRGGSSQNWLARVLRNGIYSSHRAELRRLARESRVSASEGELLTHEVVERGETSRLLVEAVMRLDEPYRSTLLMRYHEDMTPKEIAKRLAIPAGTVRARLNRGLVKLRADINQSWGKSWKDCNLALFAFAGAKGGMASTGPSLLTAAVVLVLSTAALLVIQPWADDEQEVLATISALPIIEKSTLPAPIQAALATEFLPMENAARTPIVPAVFSKREATQSMVVLRGRCVAKESGLPLAGCRIQTWGTMPEPDVMTANPQLEWENPQDQYSNEDGAFELHLDKPPICGDYTIYISRAGRLTRSASWDADSNPIVDHDFGNIPMETGTILEGRVLTEDGSLIEGASVRFGKVGGQALFDPSYEVPIFARTDEKGEYRIESALPPGDRKVEILNQGCFLLSPEHIKVLVTPNVQSEDFLVKIMPFIEGEIQFPDGSPVVTALLSADVGPGYGRLGMDWTDSEGRFRIYAPSEQEGPFSIHVNGYDYVDIQPFITESQFNWGDHGISIVAQPTLHREIRVVEAVSGSPIEEFAVRCEIKLEEGHWNSGRGKRLGGTHIDGRLLVDKLTAGTNSLNVYPWNPKFRVPKTVELEPTADELDPIEVQVELMQPFEVMVQTVDGTPVVGSDVTITTVLPDKEVLSSAVTNQQGLVQVYFPPSIAAGRISVAGEHPIEELAVTDPLSNADPILVTVGNQAHAAATLVHSVALVRKVRLYFERLDTTIGHIGLPEDQLIEPDADGIFRRTLDPGKYQVSLIVFNPYDSGGLGPKGWMKMEPALAEFQADGGEAIELNLNGSHFSPCALSGILLLDGTPQANVSFRIRYQASVEAPSYGTMLKGFRTDSEGKFLIESLMPGNYQLVYRGNDGEHQWKWELWGNDEIDLLPGDSSEQEFRFFQRSIRIRPLHPDTGDPMPGSSWRIPTIFPQQITDEDGWLSLSPAPQAEFFIFFQESSEFFRAGPIKVNEEKAETEIEIQAERPQAP